MAVVRRLSLPNTEKLNTKKLSQMDTQDMDPDINGGGTIPTNNIKSENLIAAINKAETNKKIAQNQKSLISNFARLVDNIEYEAVITDVVEDADRACIVYSVFDSNGRSREIQQTYFYKGYSYDKLIQVMTILLTENDSIYDLLGKSILVMLTHKNQYLNLIVIEEIENDLDYESDYLDDEN